VVLNAGHRTPEGARALDQLCGDYWYPLYAVSRRRGNDAHAAEDLVQGFFARLLEREDIARADPARGRFRGYLRTSFENYMRNEHAARTAAKRGGGRPHIPLDAEQRYALEPADGDDPAALFDRAWAHSLLRSTLGRLRAEYAVRDKEGLFDALKAGLAGGGPPYAEVAADLGMTEGAVKVAAHRLRQRYREALRTAVAETVESETEIEDEIQALFRVL